MQGWALTPYGLPELEFDRFEDGLLGGCRWRP